MMMRGARLSLMQASRLRSSGSISNHFHNSSRLAIHTNINRSLRRQITTNTTTRSTIPRNASTRKQIPDSSTRRPFSLSLSSLPSFREALRQQLSRDALFQRLPPEVVEPLEAALSRINAVATPERVKTGLGVVGGLTLALLHSVTGSANDFYDYRFKCTRDPDDLASFFGGETFMELFCVFPLVGVLMMRMGYFDDEGNVITQGVPGTLKVSMVFSDEANEETGVTNWFNKRERFRNIFLGCDCWDMVTNFGFRTLDDGTREVYLHGEFFHGNLPVVSQIMRLVFTLHARWLAWSTEHHLNHYAFAGDSELEEHNEEESRMNMPLFLLKNYAWNDLWGSIVGGKKLEKPASFLVRRKTVITNVFDDEDDDDEDEDEEEEEEEVKVHRHRTLLKRRASLDIASDRESAKLMLARHQSVVKREEMTPEDRSMVLARRYSLQRKNTSQSLSDGSAYTLAREAAMERHMVRRATLQAIAMEDNKPAAVEAPAVAV